MVRLKNKSKGFTIVELLIVIVVIGILATLVLVTFNGIQQKGRDSKRKTDMGTIEQSLDLYYSQNNTYPTLADLNSTTWRATNLKGFNADALQDPSASSNTVLAGSTPKSNQYSYQVTGSDGSLASPTTCDDTAGAADPCTNFGIYSLLESGNTVFSKTSSN